MAVAVVGTSSKSIHSANVLKQVGNIFSFPIKHVLTDNGSEFAKHFKQTAKELGIPHWHTYPRTPQMNAHCERFNRTLWEEHIKFHVNLLIDNMEEFNRKLLDWLYWYNCLRTHHGLGHKIPLEMMLQYKHQKSNFDRS